MTAALPAAAREAGASVEVWWQDEARVGQQGTLTRVWAERGSRPLAPRDRRYEWAYLFGAVCPERGVGAGLVLPFADADAMSLHLSEISKRVLPGAHAVVVLDGAGWHRQGGKLRVPENISLLPLPPYAPELNPVENIWQFLRQNQLEPTRLRRLRSHRGRLLLGLERTHGGARAHRLHHHPPVGKGRRLMPLV